MGASVRGASSRPRALAGALGVGLAGTALVAGLAGSAVAAASPATAPAASHARTAAAKTTKLVGTFRLTAGKHSGKTATGSYFRMVIPTGGYLPNGGSTYILLKPGTDGGLKTGSYEPEPSPAFGSKGGNSLANKIFQPEPFESVKFGASTQRIDPQTGKKVPAPSITATGDRLSGNLSAVSVGWNNQQFNQGSPKPGGSYPGRTVKVTGTYNPKTHHYTLTWQSQIVGGPFNGFAGLWHFTGTFTAS